jgi:DNA-binding transcriptional ArsR family regulator
MATASPASLDALERVGTALADPTRRRILLALLEHAAYPAELAQALGAGRTNISNHLACLRGCGLVSTRREGRQVRYELSSPRLAHALADLVDLELEVEQHHVDLDGRGRDHGRHADRAPNPKEGR